jgi:hypothetical protein
MTAAAASAIVLVACGHGGQSPRHAPPADLPATGTCRFVSASEMRRITGLRLIKPVQSPAGCSYLYDATATVPSIDPLATVAPPSAPPGIVLYVYTDPRAVANVSRVLQDPYFKHLSGLGTDAGWDNTDHELRVVLDSVAVRIVVTPPDPPQHFRTGDLQALAVEVFTTVRTRLPGVI